METMDSILSIFVALFFFIFLVLEMFLPFLIPIFFISFIRKNVSNNSFKNNNIILGNNKNKYTDISNSKLADLDINDINKLKEETEIWNMLNKDDFWVIYGRHYNKFSERIEEYDPRVRYMKGLVCWVKFKIM